MKTYFADTNIYLRFLLADNNAFYRKAENWLKKAKRGEVKIVFIPQVIFEMDYVLDKVYSVDKSERVDYLLTLVKTPYLSVAKRGVWLDALRAYKRGKIDLVDIFIFFLARNKSAQVLSFDKDIKKLDKKYPVLGRAGVKRI
jgi:predicted nucleic-acid-binding protein